MKAQITFKQAVNQIYSNKLSEVKDISSEWSLFRPYQFKDSNHKIYLRIDELPTHYHTSFDIVECAK